jgi:hypothetical protein
MMMEQRKFAFAAIEFGTNDESLLVVGEGKRSIFA